MSTSLLINIGHPDGVSANQFIDIAIKSVLNDIDADCEEGWSVTIADDPRGTALRTAISIALSEFPDAWSNEQVLEGIHDDHELVVVWEPFENWDKDDIVGYIKGTAETIYSTYF
jgi:hypothetical protein